MTPKATTTALIRHLKTDHLALTIDSPAAPAKELSTVSSRMLDAVDEIYGIDPRDLNYLHAVLAQCGLPYREKDASLPVYEKRNGNTTLLVSPGYLRDPVSKEIKLQGIPYGAKPRLLMIHLCTEAKIRNTPEVDIGTSMSSFMRELGISVTGGKTGSIGRFKDQLNRLAASRMQLIFDDDEKTSMVNAASPIGRYDVWFPTDPDQRMLWPSTVTLSTDFYNSLKGHALPLDPRAIRGLQQSAMALDIYTWLAHRLHRIPKDKPSDISWFALQAQFGPDYVDKYGFRQEFKNAMAKVLTLYKGANIELNFNGKVRLRHSPSPIAPTTMKRVR